MKTLMGFGNLALLALNLSTLGTVAYKGQLWREEPELEPASPSAALEEVLELSPAQAEGIASSREAFVNEYGRIEAQLQENRERLLAAMREEPLDPSALRQWIDEISRLQTELERRAVAELLQERDVLTPGQREQYLLHLEDRMRQGFARGRQYRGGRGGARQELVPAEPTWRQGQGQGRGKGMGKGRRSSPPR